MLKHNYRLILAKKAKKHNISMSKIQSNETAPVAETKCQTRVWHRLASVHTRNEAVQVAGYFNGADQI